MHILLESKIDLLVPSQAREEIQRLINEADKLVDQKKLLLRKRDILIHKVSALSGEMALGIMHVCIQSKINTEVKNRIPGYEGTRVVPGSLNVGGKDGSI